MRYIPTASIDGKTEARLPIALTARGREEGGDWALSQNEQVSDLSKLGGRFCRKKNVFQRESHLGGWFSRFRELRLTGSEIAYSYD